MNELFELAPLAHFSILHGKLYRKLADGTHKLVTRTENGKFISFVNGTKYEGAAIAWALHYGNWPTCRLVCRDGNPYNLHIENLVPVKGKVHRFTCKYENGIYRHPKSDKFFTERLACEEDFRLWAVWQYTYGESAVLRAEALLRENYYREYGYTEFQRVKRKNAVVPREPVKRPPRPSAIPGFEWHWYEGEWKRIPVPCHVADDYQLRLVSGAMRFEFDASTQTVQPAGK